MEKSERLLSLDALRGFDMFFITGGAGIIAGLCSALGWGDGWLAHQMSHVPWAGLAHHDTIFPLFLFLAGVSWPFSYASQVARGRTAFQIHRKVIVRALILCFFGMTLGGILKLELPFRIPSVLGQIGLSWGIAAILFIHVKKPLLRGILVAVLLFGYWAFLGFTGAPGAPIGADLYSKEFNIVSYLDRTLMPNYIFVKGVYDPESFFCVPSGVAMALLGMSAGALLKSPQFAPSKKAGILALSALSSLVLGLAFIYVLKMPIVKALWTSSFVLVTSAYSMAMLALFYWIIDVKGWKGWSFYFRVIGMNSITIYMLMAAGVIYTLQHFCLCGLIPAEGCVWRPCMWNVTYHATAWLVLYFLYRKNIFLKV